MADYGLSKFYWNKTEGHIRPAPKPSPIGTKRYLSVNVLNLQTPSRRDDLIAICYVLFELAIGYLRWNTSVWKKEFPKIYTDKKKSDAKKKEIKQKYIDGKFPSRTNICSPICGHLEAYKMWSPRDLQWT